MNKRGLLFILVFIILISLPITLSYEDSITKTVRNFFRSDDITGKVTNTGQEPSSPTYRPNERETLLNICWSICCTNRDALRENDCDPGICKTCPSDSSSSTQSSIPAVSSTPPPSTYTPNNPFDVSTGSSGNLVCQKQNGFCTKTECRVPLLPVWTEYFCRAQNYDCSTISTKGDGWIKAYCSCTDTGTFCKGDTVYQKTDTCQELLVENCAAKDMKCKGGECASCIDGFVIRDGSCVPCESLDGTWDAAAKKCNYCSLSIPSDAGKKIKKGVPTQDSQAWVYDNTESRSCSWNCSSGYVLSPAGTACVAASLPSTYSCTGNVPANAGLCTGDADLLTVDTTISLKSACGSAKCEYTCNQEYKLQEGRCVKETIQPINVEIKSIDSNPKTIGYVNQNFIVICESSVTNVNFTEAFVYSVSNKLESQCVFVERSWDNSKANFTCSSLITWSKTLKCTINGEKAALQNYKPVGTNKTKQILITEPLGQKCGTTEEVCNKLSTPRHCISIDANSYSGGDATCKDDCSGWDRTNCVLKEITTTCGDGTKGADEVCDKQLTPNKPCISINANLYSSGTATCKEDCTGWITTNCGLKTVECQDGTRKCADGTCKADCGGNELTCNSDGTCDATESCTCSDCYGRKDSCQEGSICDAVTEQCKPTTPGCGNGIIDSGEQCDCWSNNYLCSSQELNYQSCQLQGRSDGQYLSCYLPSRVGLGCKFNLEACDNPSRSCWNQGNKPCITSDGCDGEIACENGVLMGDCIKIDSTCQPPITQYQCIGSATNADLCSSDNLGLTADTTITFVSSCTDAKKCEFTCNSGFKLESGQCVQQTTILCGTGPIPTTGCQCPEGTPKYSGYCCRNAQNDLVYQDIPCDQTPTSDFTVKFTYEVKGITATFTASNPLLNYFEWDFGDGNKQEGGQNLYTVSHTYIFDGSEKSFTVNLIAHNAEGKTATASNVIKIEKSISDLPNTETCNVRGNSLALCHSSLDGCFLGSESECESCRVVSKCEDFSDDGLACRGEIPGCDRYACDWDENNVCLPKQVSEQDCQYVCIDLADESVEGYYFNGKKEYPQTCETGTCWECPTEGCKFTSPDGTTTITYIDGECVNGFKEVTIKNSGIAQDQTIIQPCSLSPVISFFTLFNIILTLSILTVFYIFRKKF